MARNRGDRAGAPNRHEDKTTFATELKRAMERNGWTQVETARQVSLHLPEGERLHPVNINHYVQGRSLPRRKYRAAIAKALGLEVFPPEITSSIEGAEGSRVVITAAPNGMARIQIDQIMPWPQALRVVEALKIEGTAE